MNQVINPRQKFFAHLDRLHEIQQGRKPAPVNCELMLSNRCDLRCGSCHYSYTHTRGPWAGHAEKPDGAISGGDLMDFDLARSILTQLADFGIKSVVFSGGGEPTLHKDFDAIIRHARDVGLQLGIYTHGGWIRDDRAAWMKKNFEWVYFSLDAHDVESYKTYKGVNRFDRVTSNIKNIVALEGTATIGVGFLIGESNWRDIHAMVRLGRSLNVNYVQFRPLIQYSQHEPGKMIEEDTAWIHHAIGRLNAYKGDSFVIADVSRFLRYAQWTEDRRGYSTCFWKSLQTVITPNGKVWTCTNKMEHPDAVLGDLSVEPFDVIWERSGSPCGIDSTCRISCRGDLANQTLDGVMSPMTHPNFI